MVLSSRDGPWTAGKFIEVGFTLQSAQRFSYWSLFTDIITFRFILHHYGLLYWFGFTHVSMKALHEWRESECVWVICVFIYAWACVVWDVMLLIYGSLFLLSSVTICQTPLQSNIFYSYHPKPHNMFWATFTSRFTHLRSLTHMNSHVQRNSHFRHKLTFSHSCDSLIGSTRVLNCWDTGGQNRTEEKDRQ